MKIPGKILTLAMILALLSPPIASPALSLTAVQSSQWPTSAPVLNTPAVDIRVNAGGGAYTDTQGKQWLADKPYTPSSWGYTGGTPYTTAHEIIDTDDDPLYQSQRSAPQQYRFDLQNDVYEVELRFAEIYCTTDCRSFNVKIEGVQLLTNFGPFKVGGAYRAVNATFLVPVTDNQLLIEFINVSGAPPIINAIRVTGSIGASPRNEVRLNAGGYDYRDTQGKLWVADQPYITGAQGFMGTVSSPYKTANAITNTNDQALFQTNRYNMTGYSFDLPNGAYRVHLLFAELYVSITGPGQRVFDVYAEGTLRIPNMDVRARANNQIYRAITETFDITLLDARLDITFTAKTANPPIVNAIAVLPLDDTPPGPWTDFTPTEWQTTQSPAVSVQVRDEESGLNVATGEYAYSTNGGASFSAWLPAATTGANGTTAPQTVSVASVPFNQDSATQNTIKFRISDVSGNQSESDVYTVRIDTSPPASTILTPVSGSMVAGPIVAIAGTATDAASGVQMVEVSTDGGTSWTTAVGTTSWSFNWNVPGDGVYNIRSRARDAVGFVESPGPGITLTVDSVPPVTFIRTPVNGQSITTTTFLVTGTAFDATSGVDRVEISGDGGTTWMTATGTTMWSYLWTPVLQGSYALRARAVDRAGNVDNPGTAVNVIVDRIPPTSSIIDPPAGKVIRGGLYTVSGVASDDAEGAGLASVEVSTDGVAWHLASGLETWIYAWDPLPADGTYTLRSRARDLAGHLQDPPYSVNVVVDNTPPVSVANLDGTPGSGGWYVSPVTLGIVSSDATSGVKAIYYRLGTGDWITYTAPVQFTANGNHALSYYALDQAGNMEGIHSLSLMIDTLAPVTIGALTGTQGGSGWYRSPVVATLTAIDTTSGVQVIYYSLNAGPWTPYTGPLSISEQGIHSLVYYARDNAGNTEGTHAQSVKVDTIPPTVTITTPTAGQVVSATAILIQGSAGDDAGSGIAAVDISINGGPWVTVQGTTSWSHQWTPPSPGVHNLRVRATDIAGNTSDPGSGIYITMDDTRPSSIIITPFDGQLLRGPTAIVTGTATDTYSSVALVEVSTDGGAVWAPATLLGGTWVYTWSIANDGMFTLRSRATDQAGNVEIPARASAYRLTVSPRCHRSAHP